MEIKRGTPVTVRSASGEQLRKRAVSGIEDGADFPIVWVSREAEWEAAQAEGRTPDAVPWPAEDVEPDVNELAYSIVQRATTEGSHDEAHD
jgi:hypothetical protein